jgi:hypothetical protein
MLIKKQKKPSKVGSARRWGMLKNMLKKKQKMQNNMLGKKLRKLSNMLEIK